MLRTKTLENNQEAFSLRKPSVPIPLFSFCLWPDSGSFLKPMSVSIKPHRTSKHEDGSTKDKRNGPLFGHYDLLMMDYSQLTENKSQGGFRANTDLTKN